MLKLLDGPAAGVSLACIRCPIFLRVVKGTGYDGGWDALDMPDDVAEPGEAISVYRRVGEAGSTHLDYRDKQGRRRGRWEQYADYRYYPRQPDDATLRDNAKWREWATAEHARTSETGNPVPEIGGNP